MEDNDLVLEQTATTPYVEAWCDLQLICMGGTASEEDSMPVLKPFNNWLKEHIDDFVGVVTLEFNFHYLSSSYNLAMVDIVRQLNKYKSDVLDFSVRWHCKEGDDMYYIGLDYQDIANFEFEVVF
ncbi:MAG: SiaC family regulatory phosphoprotein [Salinivirgaceae bacterium]|jgi:hypothetical protein|nr:SiaC family regulatory phosphoprotein [Salinivirgaceae bacterium]